MVLVKEESALYLFGGQNASSETIGDFWKYSFEQDCWSILTPKVGSVMPEPRSGHSLTLIGAR